MASASVVLWIVVPLYQPDEESVENLRGLARQAPVVAVDDGSPVTYAERLDALAAVPRVTLLRSLENQGIAAALNTGVREAIAQGATRIVTFDQDSRPEAGYVEAVRAAFEELGRDLSVGALGPLSQNPTLDSVRQPALGRYASRYPLIQSGMAFDVDVYRAVGPFDESLVIDGVDTDFCLRLKRAGLWVGVSPTLAMEHRLGVGAANHRRLAIGPFRPVSTGHGTDRRYYINRNLIHVLRRYAREEPRWAAWTVRRIMGQNLAAVLLEEERWAKLRAVLGGFSDGLRRRGGPRGATVRAPASAPPRD